MARYRSALPQLNGDLFLTDGGIETTLIFLEGLELPDFAAFDLLKQPEGETALRKYFRTYAALAKKFGTGLILEAATWRANPDWAARLGYSRDGLTNANLRAIRLLEPIRDEFEDARTQVVISGCVGPRGDGYNPAFKMTESDAESYHGEQIGTFAASAADMVTCHHHELRGGGCRCRARGEIRGNARGHLLHRRNGWEAGYGPAAPDAIATVDAATSAYPAYYMINCAHPTHFESVLTAGEPWLARIRGLRTNASHKSHAELNESPELDSGNPVELGPEHARLLDRLPRLNVIGGCCGTDHRHVEQIAMACSPRFPVRGLSKGNESRRGRPGELLTLAVSAALLSALYFIAANLISVFLLHRFVAASRDLVWMSPLSYLGFFLLAWVPVAAIGLWLQRNRALQFATLVFVALGVFAVLLPITSVARYAS
jgi:S-methylmethionine-dependent homocysteine/selenocysteine methylase